MSEAGTEIKKFTRTYYSTNPIPAYGPPAYRLIEKAGYTDINLLENLYTLPPIQYTKAQGTRTANLYFDIDSIATNAMDPYTGYQAEVIANNLITQNIYRDIEPFSGLSGIDGNPPINTAKKGNDAAVWFDITLLKNIMETRDKQRMKVSFEVSYNSRSVDTITATSPLFAETTNERALVTFDITALTDVDL